MLSQEFIKINWVLDSNAENENAYTKLEVLGQKNGFSVFSCYQLLCVPTVVLKNCKLDLSQIQGEFKWLKIIDCQCSNQFSKCKVNSLKVENTNIGIDQIAKLAVSSCLDIITAPEFEVDYQNFFKLNAIITNITLNNCKIDLTLLSGNFTTVALNSCDISGISNQLHVQTLYVRNCKCLPNTFNSIEIQSANNQEQPLKSTATNKSVYYYDCCVDLAGAQENWSNLTCNSCTFINSDGKKNENALRQNCNYIQLMKCNFKASVLNGSWNKISLDECNIQTNAKCQIVANYVFAYSVNISDFSWLTTKKLKISNCNVTNLPKNTESILDHCKLMFKPSMKHIRIINLYQCKLIKFSILYFPKAVKIHFIGNKNQENYNKIINRFKQSFITLKYNQKQLKKLNQYLTNAVKTRQQSHKQIGLHYQNITQIFAIQNMDGRE
ncbi:Hypothetical_protein [Hexamita inflata]|uniref:Hypothetical_protein n=1 Tax=Hexamita inflata TaxID=28002 RepID=A0AA86R6W8_9EUKA|nr:Hypothetical protein HINF_LOCUS54759 [Hexamita inflata]